MRVKDPAMLRRKRQNRRFSQTELGYLVRKTQQTISLLESGRMKTLSEELAIAIAARLDCDWEDLFLLEEGEAMPVVRSDSRTVSEKVAS
ncbi:helix-turn-helix domain-containing protein [Zhihengliuella sp.]|uniref:helix-turn-helix transcriptional regulator n=1 Tax=Zhihengliuella sp. TaxID=1954483 RepID=UPI002810E7B8|nr:helix-turn-helix domain-containing protein [Zhihengliuella sp.]